MNELDFIARWQIEKPIYRAWGRFVINQVCAKLTSEIAPKPVDVFLKLPPTSRTKEQQALVDKAFYRNKNYSNPYDDITDKVGARFVVLLTPEIRVVENIISNETSWSVSCDRDYQQEQKQRPDVFSYQSVHLVVRPKGDIQLDDIAIPKNTPCEVQIRTILQHAHSELTHDTIYKPKSTATSVAERYCARSMALIEATDDYFLRVFDEIEKASKPLDVAMQVLTDCYNRSVALPPDIGKVNELIIDAYKDMLPLEMHKAIAVMLEEKPYVIDKIRQRATTKHLFRQPAILLPYLLALKAEQQTIEAWPLTLSELSPILVDLGLGG